MVALRLSGRNKEIYDAYGQPALAELVGTALYTFLGAGALVASPLIPTVYTTGDNFQSQGADVVAIAMAHGTAYALAVAATVNISGGHINPATTLAAFLIGRISLLKAIVYLISQLLGGIIGAAFMLAIFPSDPNATPTIGGFGTHDINSDISAGNAWFCEVVLTFWLILMILRVQFDKHNQGLFAPFAIGVCVCLCYLFGIHLTGPSMNPARSFGPKIVSGNWAGHWLLWIGPVCGSILATAVYKAAFEKWEDTSSPNKPTELKDSMKLHPDDD